MEANGLGGCYHCICRACVVGSVSDTLDATGSVLQSEKSGRCGVVLIMYERVVK